MSEQLRPKARKAGATPRPRWKVLAPSREERADPVRRRTWLTRAVSLFTACLSLVLYPTASLAAGEQCEAAPIEVIAASLEERRLACSAADEAIRLLGRCGISLRRPLDVKIMSEVRHL